MNKKANKTLRSIATLLALGGLSLIIFLGEVNGSIALFSFAVVMFVITLGEDQ